MTKIPLNAAVAEPPLAFTLTKFCRQVGISRSSTYKLIKAGKLSTVLVSGRRLVPASEALRIVGEGAQ
jgi:predicted site-specific integrase-resolvase